MIPTKTRSRLEWVDAGKGIAIILMVLGHIIGGLLFLQLLPRPADFQFFYTWLYTFHMATLMLLSGLFLDQSLSKGTRPFVLGRIGSLYYPAILWGIVTWLATALFSSYINHHPPASNLLLLLYSPESSFWFLTILLELSLVYLLLKKLRLPGWAITVIAAGALAWGWRAGHYTVVEFGWWGLFLALGSLLRPFLLWAADRVPAILLVLISALGGYVTVVFIHPGLSASLAGVTTSLCGVAMLISLGILLARAPGNTWPVRLIILAGRHSLQIYMLHSLAWVAARTILLRVLHIPSGIAVLLISWTMGVLVPIAAAELAIRFRLTWLFRLDLMNLAPRTSPATV